MMTAAPLASGACLRVFPPRSRRAAGIARSLATIAAGLVLTGCGPTRFEAELNVPPPLVTKIPIVVGVHMPLEFVERVYEEKRRDYSVSVSLGKAQSSGFMRLMNAMFLRAEPVQGTGPSFITGPDMRGILEPVLEDYSFITPRDSNTPLYAVSIKYRVNAYNREGQLFESWTFTGYGSVESTTMGLKGTNALKQATQLAMRDAAAKLAAEFREQAIVRGLLPADVPAPGAAAGPAGEAGAAGAAVATPGAAPPQNPPAAGSQSETPVEQPAPPSEGTAPAEESPAPSEQPSAPAEQTPPEESKPETVPTEQSPASDG